MRQLFVEVKQVYGKDTIYPACDDSKLFCQLTGRKTFTDADVRYIKALGYAFEVKTPTLKGEAA